MDPYSLIRYCPNIYIFVYILIFRYAYLKVLQGHGWTFEFTDLANCMCMKRIAVQHSITFFVIVCRFGPVSAGELDLYSVQWWDAADWAADRYCGWSTLATGKFKSVMSLTNVWKQPSGDKCKLLEYNVIVSWYCILCVCRHAYIRIAIRRYVISKWKTLDIEQWLVYYGSCCNTMFLFV